MLLIVLGTVTMHYSIYVYVGHQSNADSSRIFKSMNNTIDHAILIPAYAKTIWRHLSNPEENTEWQISCDRITYLNSVRDGRGIRYRATAKNGQESVVEITAWYPGLGYEYIIADGFNHQNRGRIRLQEVAEGTVVQWTFNYETSGLMGSLSNSLSLKRKLNNEIIKNLQALYQYIGQVAEKVDTNQIKSVMRDAPDAEVRAHYQPRYPSALDEDEAGAARTFDYANRESFAVTDAPNNNPMVSQPAQDIAPQQPATPTPDETIFQRPDPGTLITEPPLSDVDTKPNPAIQETDEKPVDEPLQTSDFTATDQQSSEPALEASENQFVIPKPPFEPSQSEPDEIEEDIPEMTDDAVIEASTSDESIVEVADEAETTSPSATDKAEIPPVKPTPTFSTEPEQTKPTRSQESKASPAIDADNIFDTSQISVFEIFGLDKPSETQEVRAILDEELIDTPPADTVEEAETETSKRGRIGLRVLQRRKSVKIKYPH